MWPSVKVLYERTNSCLFLRAPCTKSVKSKKFLPFLQSVKSTSLELIIELILNWTNWNWIVYFYFSLMCYMKKQPPVLFYKKCVLKHFTKFTGKHPFRNFLFSYSSRPEVCSFIKKETLTQVFSSWFRKIFKSISGRLLVSVKETINYFYRRESCKYDSVVKRKTFASWTKYKW